MQFLIEYVCTSMLSLDVLDIPWVEKKKILLTKMSHHASSGRLQEVKNNGNLKTVSLKSGHGRLGL